MKLLCEMFGLQMADFDNVRDMDMERQRTYAQGLDRYLQEMEAKGETVYEDYLDKDGNPVKMAVGSFNLVILNNKDYEKCNRFIHPADAKSMSWDVMMIKKLRLP